MKNRNAVLSVVALALTTGVAGYGIRAARADGVPSAGALTYSGTLEDTTGKPVSGTKLISVAVWDSVAMGNKVCEAPVASVAVANGRFDVALPDACAAAAKANPNLWIEVVVESESLGRSKLGAVPYALEAGAASEAKGALKTALDALTTSVASLPTKANKNEIPIVTGWQTYTPSITCGDATTPVLGAVAQGAYRRVGDMLEVQMTVNFDSKPPNCTGQNVAWVYHLPQGLVYDAARTLPGGHGSVSIFTNGIVTTGRPSTLPNRYFVAYANGKGEGIRQESSGLYNFDTSSQLTLEAKVPIMGWTTTGP